MTAELQAIPARSGKALRLAAGQRLKLINTHGSQVVDTWALAAEDAGIYFSVEQTRRLLLKLHPSAGDTLYSNRRDPMLVLEEDSTPGSHDMIIACCDAWVYEKQGLAGHASCRENFFAALSDIGVPPELVPNPLNLWMNVPVSAAGEISLHAPLSRPGDHVVFRPLIDVVMVFSACPADFNDINGKDRIPKEVHYLLID